MNDWLKHWEDRYSKEGYAFGDEPNEYFKEQLDRLNPGKILLPAEGEGRNAVYAATLGWEVHAFDISALGKKKAMQLAESKGVSIDYQVGELPSLAYEENQFDAIALIYAHFPADIKSQYHRMLDKLLRKGGVIIFEAFSKNHLEYKLKNPQVGGPSELAQLFSIEEIRSDFQNYEVLQLEEQVLNLKEGPFHSGLGSVIRFVGRSSL
ncbi:MAG: class I SAM-dependent methyltransferase [Cyclobacteriaceae bacterium]